MALWHVHLLLLASYGRVVHIGKNKHTFTFGKHWIIILDSLIIYVDLKEPNNDARFPLVVSPLGVFTKENTDVANDDSIVPHQCQAEHVLSSPSPDGCHGKMAWSSLVTKNKGLSPLVPSNAHWIHHTLKTAPVLSMPSCLFVQCHIEALATRLTQAQLKVKSTILNGWIKETSAETACLSTRNPYTTTVQVRNPW